jgi:hypothetical protein
MPRPQQLIPPQKIEVESTKPGVEVSGAPGPRSGGQMIRRELALAAIAALVLASTPQADQAVPAPAPQAPRHLRHPGTD